MNLMIYFLSFTRILSPLVAVKEVVALDSDKNGGPTTGT